MSGDLFFCSNNISLYLNFRPWRFTIYSNKLILIRKKVCRSIPFKKEWQKSVKSLLDFLLETRFLNYEISACPGMSRITWFLVFVTVSNHGIESINEDSKNLLTGETRSYNLSILKLSNVLSSIYLNFQALKMKLQGWLESALKSSKQVSRYIFLLTLGAMMFIYWFYLHLLQRNAVEKARQQIVDTQDIQHQIPEMNSKLPEDHEKKQIGKVKLCKFNEVRKISNRLF